MAQVFFASLVLALMASSAGIDSGIILRIDDCALVNLVTDTLLGMDILHSTAMDPSLLKSISKKGSSPIKGISKMKVDSFAFTDISLTFLPGYGMEMFVTTKSAVSGKSIVGGKTEMKMEVKIITKSSLTHEPPACPKFISGECKTELLDVKTNLPKGVLPSVMENFVDRTLKKMLPTLMCPPVDKVLHIMNGLLCNETATYQVGTSSSVQYNISKLPEVTENFLEVDFNIMINPELKKDDAKKSVHRDLPMKQHSTTLTMSVDYLNGIMHALQKEGAFNINVTVPEDLLNAFVGMIPGIPPKTTSLEVKLMVEKTAEVILKPDKALFVLQPTMEVLASTSGANLQSLFVLSAPLDIQAQFSVEGLTLHPSLLLEGISLSVASSSVGSFDVIVTGGFVKAVMYTYTLTINELLGAGVPLPTLMSINFDNAEKEMNDGLLMFSIDACKDKRKL